jgi:hypothetical protein
MKDRLSRASVEWVVRFRATLPFFVSRQRTFDSITDRTRRRMAIHFTKDLMLDA